MVYITCICVLLAQVPIGVWTWGGGDLLARQNFAMPKYSYASVEKVPLFTPENISSLVYTIHNDFITICTFLCLKMDYLDMLQRLNSI